MRLPDRVPGIYFAVLDLPLAVVFWLGLAPWVFRDARRRIGEPLLVFLATLVGDAALTAEAKIALVDDTIPPVPQAEPRAADA